MPASQTGTAVENVVRAILRGQELLLSEGRARVAEGLRNLQAGLDLDGSAGRSASKLLLALDALAAEVVSRLCEYPVIPEVRDRIAGIQGARGALRRAIRPRPRPAS